MRKQGRKAGNRNIAIILDRSTSSRFPGKSLMPLNGKAGLLRMIERIECSKKIDELVIAIPYKDKKLINFCKSINVKYFEGPENDVLGRFFHCAVYHKADIVVDFTSDCPLVSHYDMDYLIDRLWTGDYDYAANDSINKSWYNGSDIQVCTIEALCRIHMMVPINAGGRTHSLWNIGVRPKQFKCLQWIAPKELRHPDWGLTLDEKDDLVLLDNIFCHFEKKPRFTTRDVVEYIDSNPSLLEINKHVRRKLPEEG